MTGLTTMNIVAYSDREFSDKIGKSYSLLVKPGSPRQDRGVEYVGPLTPVSGKTPQEFNRITTHTLSADAVLGLTDLAVIGEVNLPDEVNQLRGVIYAYNGENHRENFVELSWGFDSFRGVLTHFSLSYNLFKPNGDPLRADLSLRFVSCD